MTVEKMVLEGLYDIRKADDNSVFVVIKPECEWMHSMSYRINIGIAFDVFFGDVELWVVFRDGEMWFKVKDTVIAEAEGGRW